MAVGSGNACVRRRASSIRANRRQSSAWGSDLRDLVNESATRASEFADVLPGANKRRDALEIDQLRGWFAVRTSCAVGSPANI